jgi:transposase
MKSRPADFLVAVEPFREDLVVAVECIFTWYWLADLCREEGIEFVLGHALYMKAIHGGKAKNDRIDAYKIAALLRGGTLPKAYVYPPEMRAARDLLRRRPHLVRRRANLLAHIQNTHHQYNLDPPAAKIAYKSNREGVAEVFEDLDVRKSMEIDLAMIEHYDATIRELELHLSRRAKQHDPQAYHRLRSVPGIGKILALTILYEIQDIARFPRVQDFLSYSRLVKCEHSSAGKKLGSGGSKIGNAHLKWAFSEAASLFLRNNAAGQKHLRRLAGKHGKSKALSILAAKLGRAVYLMLTKDRVFEMDRFLAETR